MTNTRPYDGVTVELPKVKLPLPMAEALAAHIAEQPTDAQGAIWFRNLLAREIGYTGPVHPRRGRRPRPLSSRLNPKPTPEEVPRHA